MATLEQLKKHIAKSKNDLTENIKKAEDPGKCVEVRKIKKRVKRLTRKVAKIAYFEKKAEERKKSKKDRKAAAS
ncbi:MAG: hypothetical protein ACE5E9_02130 [Nitrospinaceae bacterium]